MTLLVFDSGIGGLGVVEQIRRIQPDASITYLADNGFYPYGEKPDEILIARILKIVGQGIELTKPDAVVIACNTASTVALSHLRETFALPFIGCVPPIKPAAAASQTRHIGLLATAATIRRPYLQDLVRNFAGNCTVHSHGTPILADLAEKKFIGQPPSLSDLSAAIAPLLNRPGADLIDSVALGCTHYTFLLPELRALHPNIQWFDPANPVARQTNNVASRLPASAPGPHANTAFFTAVLPEAGTMKAKLAAYGLTLATLTNLN
jgi:glutamate racemase